MMMTFVKVKVLGHHGITWGHNINRQGMCHCDDTVMSSYYYFNIWMILVFPVFKLTIIWAEIGTFHTIHRISSLKN